MDPWDTRTGGARNRSPPRGGSRPEGTGAEDRSRGLVWQDPRRPTRQFEGCGPFNLFTWAGSPRPSPHWQYCVTLALVDAAHVYQDALQPLPHVPIVPHAGTPEENPLV